jgi:16S rRNA (guanine(966)-N(2))-methyltransferase RsmD
MMRIYGNRELKTLPGRDTRPTTARVREALFNIWQTKIVGSRWLDLFAGNGSMGAEALCRGAREVVGIEQSSRACGIIKYNWQKVAHSEQKFKVLRGDVRSRLKSLAGEKFDLIYVDPPYSSNLYQSVLDTIVSYNLLQIEGEIAVEHNPQGWRNMLVTGLKLIRTKIYGHTALSFYCLNGKTNDK